MCDCADEQLIQEFHTAFDQFMDDWRDRENMHGGIIMPVLLAEVKVEACFYYSDFIPMVGILSHGLHDGLEIMFNDIHPHRKGLTNAPDTL